VLGLFGQKELLREPIIAKVNHTTCAGCFSCQEVCAYKAIEPYDIKDKKGNLIKRVAEINKGKCQGCGACAATCRSNSIQLSGFTDYQIFAQINHITGQPFIEESLDEAQNKLTETRESVEKNEEEIHDEEPILVSHREKS